MRDVLHTHSHTFAALIQLKYKTLEQVICAECTKKNPTDAKYCSSCGYALPVTVQAAPITPEQPKKKRLSREDRKKRMIMVVVTMLSASVASVVAERLFSGKPSFDKVMMQAASEINKSCPLMADADTRLDNAIALPNNTFQYNYTLVNFNASEIDTNALKEKVVPGMINNFKTNPELKIFRDNHTTIAYNYRDKSGSNIVKLLLSADQFE